MKTAMQLMEELGLHEGGVENWIPGNAWETFADRIRADEREACAKVCDELHWPWHMGDNSGPKECAEAIRARGNT